MERRTLGWIFLGTATVAAITTGVILYRRSRRATDRVISGPLGRAMPKPVGKVTRDGYTLTEYRKEELPIEERVAILQDLIHQSVKDPKMRKLALQITHHCPARDTACESKAIHNWMKKNIRYSGDIAPHKLGRHGPVEGIDLFQSAARTVEFRAGDCDDAVGLDCTLTLLNGIPCRIKVTSPTGNKKTDDYSHVYALHGHPKTGPRKWIPSDSTLPGKNRYGIEAPYAKSLVFAA